MKHSGKIKFAAWFIVFFLTISFSKESQFKPTKDFSWLGKFAIFDEMVTLRTWTDLPTFKKDSAGVITAGGKYNPCSIAEYALKTYDEYQKTNDPELKKIFLIQVKWLIDSANYRIINGNMLGHPYKYTFHDLKPDWYSGFTESEFISVLIRYYYMTKDARAIPLIIASRNFILTSEQSGGMRSETPECNVWVEEYVPSKQERHVITGYVITLICMNEYCRMFPDDKEAKQTLDLCVESFKKSVMFYDDGNGNVAYNRGDKRICNPWYLKMITLATREIYRNTGDPFFKNQYKLWSTYTYNKKVGRPIGTCIMENYNFSSLLSKDSTGWYRFDYTKNDTCANPPVALPEFLHFTVDFNNHEENSTLKFNLVDVDDYLIFYRQAATSALLNKEKWTQAKMFAQNNYNLQSDAKCFTRFLFIFKRQSKKSSIGAVSFLPNG
jgi:hypothetical protein